MKKKWLPLLLCLMMVSGLMMSTAASGAESYLDFHVDSFAELKAALEQSSPTVPKRIYIDKSFTAALTADDFTEGNDLMRTAVCCTGESSLIFSENAVITLAVNVDYGYPTNIFKIAGDGTSLSVYAPDRSAGFAVTTNGHDRLFYSRRSLLLCGGSYRYLVSEDRTYNPAYANNLINYQGELTVLGAEIYVRNESDYGGVYCINNDSVASKTTVIDTEITMSSSIEEDAVFVCGRGDAGDYRLALCEVITEGNACVSASPYSSFFDNSEVYQDGIRIYSHTSFDKTLIGTTRFDPKNGEDEYQTFREEQDYSVYAAGSHHTILKEELVVPNAFSVLTELDVPEGVTLPFTYGETTCWHICDETDGTAQEPAYTSGVTLKDGAYVQEGALDLDGLNAALEGGIAGKILHIDKVSAERTYRGVEEWTDTFVYGNRSFIYGGTFIDSTEYTNARSRFAENIYKGNILKNSSFVDDLGGNYMYFTCFEKRAVRNGKIVFEELNDGDEITAGIYRMTVYIIPRLGCIISPRTVVELGNGCTMEDKVLEPFPNKWSEYEDVALVCRSGLHLSKKIFAESISELTASGSIAAGDTLGQSGPITVAPADGVSEVYYIYDRNGKTAADGTAVTYGDYDCCLQVGADAYHELSSRTTLHYDGADYSPESVSDDGRWAWFYLPTAHIDCEHSASGYQHSDLKHWQYCSVCGARCNEADHAFTQSVSGDTVTYTCSVCGFKKTGKVAETRTGVYYISMDPGTAFVGQTLSSSVGLNYATVASTDQTRHYQFATVQSVQYSTAGSTYRNEQTTVTVTLQASGNYYFKKSTIASAGMQYTRQSCTASSDGNTLTVVFTFTPYTPVDVTLTLPDLTVGKTYAEIAGATKFTVDGEAAGTYGISIKKSGDADAVIGTVTDGVPGEAYLSDYTIQPETEYIFTAWINSLGSDFPRSLTITNPTVATAIKDTCVQETLVEADAVYITDAQNITKVNLTLTKPTTGAAPATAAFGEGRFTVGTPSWSGAPKIFAADTAYTVTMTLTPESGYSFDTLVHATVNGYPASAVRDGENLTVSCTFPKTEKIDFLTWRSEDNETVTVSAEQLPGGGTVLVAEYTDGKMTAVQQFVFTAASGSHDFTVAGTAAVKCFLVDTESRRPLCAALVPTYS